MWMTTRSNYRNHVFHLLEILVRRLKNKFFSIFLLSLLELKIKKIDWNTRHDHWPHYFPSCIVDTTACSVEAVKLLNPARFYSIKHKDHVLKYQVVVSMRSPRILHVSNAFPGSFHDLTIARTTGLVEELSAVNETCIGDKTYQGPPQFITPFKVYNNISLHPIQILFNETLEKYRNFVERVNDRLKIFQSIQQRWRHPIEKHPLCFMTVSIIVNLSFSFRPLNEDD